MSFQTIPAAAHAAVSGDRECVPRCVREVEDC